MSTCEHMSWTYRLMLIIALSIAACQPPAAQETNFYEGRDGITLAFGQGSPAEEVYEDTTLPVFVTLRNQGAHDVRLEEIIFNVTGNPFYIGVEPVTRLGVPPEPDQFNPEPPEMLDYLNAKSLHFPEGEWLTTKSLVTYKKIVGLRQAPTTQVYARVCYPYETLLSTEICVDLNAFNQNVQRQVCTAEDLAFQDQGAPVAVVKVENRPMPFRASMEGGRGSMEAIQHVFVIHVRNVGRGGVLQPRPITTEERVRACGQEIAREKLNSVGIRANLSGVPLECSPRTIVLSGGEGFATCSLPPEEAVSLTGPNYFGLLNVKVDYLYMESIATDVKILRRPEGLRDPYELPYDARDEHPGYINGQTRCEYCSMHRSDPKCGDWPDKANQTAIFSCACGEMECQEKSRDGKCLFGYTWCPGASYCCVPEH